MNENNRETFLTTERDEKQVLSLDFNDDEMDIEMKSSADSPETLGGNTESDGMANRNESLFVSHAESIDGIETKITVHGPSTSLADEQPPIVIPRAVYDYAAMVNHTLESPRQTKLDHDVVAVLGSSDPPPGFGFLHPRFYYLEQKRPIPLEPLQVWRGYHGHVYFTPIQVQPLESDRIISPEKSLKSTAAQSVPILKKTITERPNTILSAFKNQNANLGQNHSNNERLSLRKRAQIETTTNASVISSANQRKDETLVTLINGEENNQDSTKMWQSVVTSAHMGIKPISKRSQHAMDDLQTLQQEQTLQDPTGYNRQVLPNIRPVPKSKFVYKGLAYKESQKLPGITNGTDNDGNALQKPLVAYNLAQAYARYEINAARAKQNLPQQPVTLVAGPTTKDQQSHDIRGIRKRIVRGTTLSYRPPTQSVSWTPGRVDHRSTLGSEVLLSVRPINTLNHTPISFVFPSHPQQPHLTVHTTPNLSQSTFHRPSTSKSSIPQKKTTIVEMPILTKNINQPRDSSRYTNTTDIVTTL